MPLGNNFRLAATAMFVVAAGAFAQHGGDILVDYQGGKIFVKPGPEGLVFEGEFSPPEPLLGEPLPFTDDPGFDTLGEETGHYGLIPGDILGYNVMGPLVFHDGNALATPTADLLIIRGVTATVTGSSGFQGGFGIGIVDLDFDDFGQPIGVFHKHVQYKLSSALAPTGAYGVQLQLWSNNLTIAPSDPFWIIFNWGLDEETFEDAVHDITAIPEASSLALAVLAGVPAAAFALRRRRRRS